MRKTKTYDLSLLIFRVGVATLMLTHGYKKFMKLLEGSTGFADPIGIGETTTFYLAILSEFIAPIFIIIGYKTRLASIFPMMTMLTAALIVHANDPFARQEMPLLYLASFFMIFMVGPGKISLDKYLK
jgi:putative oxidoreductase